MDFLRQTRLTPAFKRLLWKFIVATSVASLLIIIQGTLLWLSEDGLSSSIANPGDGIYFVLVSIFGETTSPSSLGARIIMLLALSEGLILATYFIVLAASFTLRGGAILATMHKNHTIQKGDSLFLLSDKDPRALLNSLS